MHVTRAGLYHNARCIPGHISLLFDMHLIHAGPLVTRGKRDWSEISKLTVCFECILMRPISDPPARTRGSGNAGARVKDLDHDISFDDKCARERLTPGEYDQYRQESSDVRDRHRPGRKYDFRSHSHHQIQFFRRASGKSGFKQTAPSGGLLDLPCPSRQTWIDRAFSISRVTFCA